MTEIPIGSSSQLFPNCPKCIIERQPRTHDYDTGMPAQDYLEATRNLTNREQINADFHDSQSECLHLLHQLRRKLADEESALSMFMDNYLKELE